MMNFVKIALVAGLFSFAACSQSQQPNANEEAAATQTEAPADQADTSDQAPADQNADQADTKAAGVTDPALVGQEFPLRAIDGEAFGLDGKVTIAFSEDGRISGDSGCNRFMGSYTVPAEGDIQIKLGGSTMMMCSDAQMAVEQKVLAFLPTVSSYSIDAETGAITLSTEDGASITGAQATEE